MCIRDSSVPVLNTGAVSASMCPTAAEPRSSNLFDPAYYEDLMARPFREGTIGESPVLPGTGLFMPVGTGAAKDKGLFRRVAPVFNPSKCTGCLDCAMVCPDVAIPNTVHEIHDLLLTGIASIDATEAQRESLRVKVYPLAERVRESYRQAKTDRSFSEVVAEAAKGIDADKSTRRHLNTLVTTLVTRVFRWRRVDLSASIPFAASATTSENERSVLS